MDSHSRTQTNGHATDKMKDALEMGGNALDAVTEAASAAQIKMSKAAGTTAKVVKANPLKSVAALLSIGAVCGAAAHALFAHKPTITELLSDRLGLERRLARMRKSWF